jgi:hypothetical protein
VVAALCLTAMNWCWGMWGCIRRGGATTKKSTCSMGFMIAILMCLLHLSAGRSNPSPAGDDFRRYVVETTMPSSVSSYAHPQAARSYVKWSENLHGYKLHSETTWLDK